MADPTLQITVTQGPDAGKKLLLQPGKTYRIGCGVEDDLVLTDPMVLKGHCSLEVTTDGSVLRNHTASAGTYIGEKKIAQARVPAKATFRIGDSHIQIRPVTRNPQASTGAPAAPERKAVGGNSPGEVRRGGPNDPLLGKIVGGYKLLEVVGRGGMGTVYKAVQLSLQREVALKVLARRYSRDDNFRDLFINEARAAAQLVHPNIVQVYDAGIEGDVSFFSMEFISQGSVEEILQRDKQIPWEEAILMVLEAAHGLEYAEGKQIVHRDIKPDNLMLNEDGRIKIADLGLAKQGEGGADQGIIGTPHFIPPEQALGKNVDTRADIYSLGATFFRMITGKTLFTGKTAKEIVLKHIKEPAPAASSVVSDLPGELDGVIAKMLAKNPDSRYANASELVHALETVCAHHGIKGAIIKRGVSKKVLVPLFLLLIGAAYAIFHFATQEPEVYEDPIKLAKQKEDRERREEAERERKKAYRNFRRGEVVTAWGKMELEYAQEGGIKGVQQHRDDQGQAASREATYEKIAEHFDSFAKRDDVTEFDSELGYIKLASAKAKEIRDTIKEVKETEASKGKQIGVWVTEASAIYKKERDALGKFSVAQKFSDAYQAADRLSREKPLPGDPFETLLTQVWQSPLNPNNKQSARDTKPVTDVVAKAREFFDQEKSDIPDRAEAAWSAVAKQLPPAAEIAAVSDEKLENAIKLLEPVIETFGNAQSKIKDCWDAADSRRRLIERELKSRKQSRVFTDRAAVRDTFRANRSLAQDVRPNNVMNGDFADAKSAWQRLLDNELVKTDRYRAFVRERIESLRYIEYLFSQFAHDVARTDALRSSKEAPLRSLNCEFEVEGRRQPFTFKLDTAENAATDRFFMSKKYKGKKFLLYGQFGMDWVYDCIFRVPGGSPDELRWRTPTPVVRFALALFLFETMQYADAVEVFDSLAKDKTYGTASQSFSERARVEAEARAAYETLIKAERDAKTSAEIKVIIDSLTAYGQKYAATLFWVDVMPRGRALAVDIAPDTKLKVPPLPQAPDPVK